MKNPVVEFAQSVLDAAELVKRADDVARAVAEAEERLGKLRGEAEAQAAQMAARAVDEGQRSAAAKLDADEYARKAKAAALGVVSQQYAEADSAVAKARGEVRFLEGVKDKLASECANLSGAVSELTTQKTDLESAISRLKDSIAKV